MDERKAMKLLRRLGDLYTTYRRAMWLTGLLGTFTPSLLGYGMYALQTIKAKRDMIEADPEHAGMLDVEKPVAWLTQASGWLPSVVKAISLIGVLALIIAIVAFIAKRTSFTGRDKTEPQQEDWDDGEEDDYSEEDEDDDMSEHEES